MMGYYRECTNNEIGHFFLSHPINFKGGESSVHLVLHLNHAIPEKFGAVKGNLVAKRLT